VHAACSSRCSSSEQQQRSARQKWVKLAASYECNGGLPPAYQLGAPANDKQLAG
jgi:hypothetical protein